MGKDLIIISKKKLNIKHILITLIGIIAIITIIVVSISKIKIARIKYSQEKTVESLQNIKNNEILENEEKEKNKQEEEIKKFQPLSEEQIKNVDNIYKHSDKKRVFLTFDDGPTKQVTPYILGLLNQEKIKANFFLLGTRVEQNPELVKQEYADGHYIGNHGYSHKYSKIYENIDSLLDEYNKTNQLIKDAIQNQNYNSQIFRFPGGSVGGYYGELKKEAVAKLKENGIANLDWNALTNDSDGANTKEKIMENFYKTVKGKSSIVLLMHDAADKILTYETLPEIISYLKDNGYTFETLYDVIQQ